MVDVRDVRAAEQKVASAKEALRSVCRSWLDHLDIPFSVGDTVPGANVPSGLGYGHTEGYLVRILYFQIQHHRGDEFYLRARVVRLKKDGTVGKIKSWVLWRIDTERNAIIIP